MTKIRNFVNPYGTFSGFQVGDLVELSYLGSASSPYTHLPVVNVFTDPPTVEDSGYAKLYRKTPVVGMVVAKWEVKVARADGDYEHDNHLAVLVDMKTIRVTNSDYFFGVRLKQLPKE